MLWCGGSTLLFVGGVVVAVVVRVRGRGRGRGRRLVVVVVMETQRRFGMIT